jgi:hypothetical protein
MSTIMNEEVATQSWLRDYLDADATLAQTINGVYVRSVPIKQALPVVKLDRLQATDLYTVGLYRVWADQLWLVRGIVHWQGSGQQDWSDVQTIANRIDVLLHKQSITASPIQLDIFREESYTDEQAASGGGLMLHGGGLYRIRAHAL